MGAAISGADSWPALLHRSAPADGGIDLPPEDAERIHDRHLAVPPSQLPVWELVRQVPMDHSRGAGSFRNRE